MNLNSAKDIVGIIGAGAWGSALAQLVARSGAKVILWSFDGKHEQFGLKPMKNITQTQNTRDLYSKSCNIWIAVTPAAFFRDTMNRAKEFYTGQPIIICTKGAEPDTGKFMTDVLHETIAPKKKNVGVLSGPQFAAEVAHGVPTGSTLAGGRKIQEVGGRIFKELFLSSTKDVIGTEICGVGKNAVSVISGYIKVKGRGENESALSMTTAWNEVVQLGLKFGAKEKTFLDFCGLGDLLLTATSTTSRNFSAGVAIAEGKKPEGTVEGISALSALVKKARDAQLHIPFLSDMCRRLSK